MSSQRKTARESVLWPTHTVRRRSPVRTTATKSLKRKLLVPAVAAEKPRRQQDVSLRERHAACRPEVADHVYRNYTKWNWQQMHFYALQPYVCINQLIPFGTVQLPVRNRILFSLRGRRSSYLPSPDATKLTNLTNLRASGCRTHGG